MGEALRELAAVLEVQFDPKGEMKRGDAELSGLVGTLKEAGKIFIETFALEKIKDFVEGQVEAALALEHTADRMGITTEKLEEYQLAAGLSGVETETFNASLSRLSRTIGEAASKGQDLKVGLQTIKLKDVQGQTRDTGDVFEELAEKISALPSASEKSRVAFELFGHQGARLIPLLNKGKEGFIEARKAMEELGGPTSKEFIEDSKKVEGLLVQLKFAWGNVSQSIAAAFLPKVIKVIEFFVKMGKAALDLNKNTHILTTGLIFLGAIAVQKLITQLAALATQAGITGIRTALAFAVPILIAAALYLAFDEVYTLLEGGDTIIGRAANAFLGFGAAQDIAQDLRDIWQVFLNLMKAVGDAAGDTATIIVEGFKLAWAELQKVEDSLESLLSKIPGASYVLGFKQGGRPAAEKAATDQDAERAKDAASHAFGDIGKIFGRDPGAGTTIGKPSVRSFYNAGNQGPPPKTVTVPGGAQLPSLTINQEMHFKNPPGDPQAVGKAAKRGAADAQQRGHYHAAVAASKP